MITKREILKQSRRKIRYQLYRIRTHEEGGASHMADALKEFYESQEGFTGWSGFAREWDLDEEGNHDQIVKREISEEQIWNNQLASLAVDLPWPKK